MVLGSIILALITTTLAQEPTASENTCDFTYKAITDVGKHDLKIGLLEAKLQDAFTTIDELNAALNNVRHAPVISTYVRWGKITCPIDAQKVYDGFAAGSRSGHPGSGANILCLPSDPVWGSYNDIIDTQATLHGVDYKFGGRYDGHEAPCVLCSVPRASSVMIPGRNVCYDGWKLEYSGYLASTRSDDNRSEYICLDEHFEAIGGPTNNEENGIDLYYVEARCSTLPCDVYPHGREVTCVVCSYSPSTSNYVPYA